MANFGLLRGVDPGEYFTRGAGHVGALVFDWRNLDGCGAVSSINGDGLSSTAGDSKCIEAISSTLATGDDPLSTRLIRTDDG